MKKFALKICLSLCKSWTTLCFQVRHNSTHLQRVIRWCFQCSFHTCQRELTAWCSWSVSPPRLGSSMAIDHRSIAAEGNLLPTDSCNHSLTVFFSQCVMIYDFVVGLLMCWNRVLLWKQAVLHNRKADNAAHGGRWVTTKFHRRIPPRTARKKLIFGLTPQQAACVSLPKACQSPLAMFGRFWRTSSSSGSSQNRALQIRPKVSLLIFRNAPKVSGATLSRRRSPPNE